MSKPETAIVKAPDPLRQIVQWIIGGQSEPDIREAIAKTWPGAKAKALIISALKEVAKAGHPDPDLIRGFAIEGTREIYRKAIEVGDHQTGLRALKQLVELSKR